MVPESPPIPQRGLLTLSDAAWAQAVLRSQTIAPLAALRAVGRAQADEAAAQLGLSRRRVYVLIQRYRQGLGVATDLTPGRSDGGKGKRRLPEPVERLIRERIQKRFLSRPKCTLAALYRDVARACRSQGLPVPAQHHRLEGCRPGPPRGRP
jgi:putative transposase